MSYGSTFVQFEANGRMSQKFSRHHLKKEDLHERHHKVVHYDKQFDVNLSRVENHSVDKASVRDSMLSYTKKMRSLQDARYASANSKGDPLFVRAKHIPKYPTKAPKKRRPMSFDELLGRDRDTVMDKQTVVKSRPHSDKTKPKSDDDKSQNELHLPLLSERLRKTGPSVQVSLVSASDLYEIVDFSLRSKATRNESLQMLRMEAEVGHDKHYNEAAHAHERIFPEESYKHFERNSEKNQMKMRRLQRIKETQKLYDSNYLDNNHIPSEEFYEEIFSMDKDAKSVPSRLPSLSSEPFRRRPQRAKRMKLIDPGLGAIPEDNVIETHNSPIQLHRDVVVTSPPLSKTPTKPQDALNKPSLGAIQEYVEKVSVNESNKMYGTESIETSPRIPESPEIRREYRGYFPFIDERKSSKKIIKDDGDVRIEVTQCPPKYETVGAKQKAQKRFKKLIFLRDMPK